VSLVVYGDFADPYCYLASRRVDQLRGAGVAVDWRAVQQQPLLPVTGARDADRLTELGRRRDEVAALLEAGEDHPGVRPGFVPNTQAAVSAYAEAYGAGVGDEVRRLLFTLYWESGVDIGSPHVLRTPLAGVIARGSSLSDPLRRFGYAVSVTGGPITTAAWRRIRGWREKWQRLETSELPVVLDDSGAALSGTAALQRLAERAARLDSRQDREPVPRIEPAVPPPIGWASQVGGSWGRAGWLDGAY
jgi:hypothetical protein